MPTNEPVTIKNEKGVAKHLDDNGISYNIAGNEAKDVKYTLTMQNPNQSGIPENTRFNDYKPVVFEKENNSGNDGTTNPLEAKTKINHLVKSMTPYAARYIYGNNKENSVIVNYTLDNFLVINGQKKITNGANTYNQTYTKAGYLLNNKVEIEDFTINSSDSNLLNLVQVLKNPEIANDEIIDAYIDELRKNRVEMTLTLKNPRVERPAFFAEVTKMPEENIKLNNDKIEIKYHKDYEATVLPPDLSLKAIDKKEYYNKESEYNSSKAYADQQINAIKYYLKSIKFTKWVNKELGNLTIENLDLESINPIAGKASKDNVSLYQHSDLFSHSHKKLYKNEKIFNSEKLLDENSYFHLHRRMVIKNVVLYNLLVSSINYNQHKYDGKPFYQLPLIKERDWDVILSNISFTAFVEGFDLGVGVYNDYKTVGSTNNNFLVSLNTLSFVRKDAYNKGNNLDPSSTKDYYIPIKEIINGNKEVKDEIFEKDFANLEDLLVGKAENKFINDGKYKDGLEGVILENKNYKYPTVGIDFDKHISNNDVEKGIKYTENQKKRMMIALASEKYIQPKLINYSENATVTYGLPNTSNTFNINSNSVISMPDMQSLPIKGVKKVTLTYKVKERANIQPQERRANALFTFDFVLKNDHNQIAKTETTRENKGNAYAIATISNGLEKDGAGKFVPFNQAFNKVEIKNLKGFDTVFGQTLTVTGYEIEVIGIRFEGY